MANYNDIVWPFKAPPVYTGNWDNQSWLKYIRSFRPADYNGAEDDKETWLDYLDQKNLAKIQKDWPDSIVTLVGRNRFNFAKKE